jgi:hypothetical protein
LYFLNQFLGYREVVEVDEFVIEQAMVSDFVGEGAGP